MQLGVSSYGFSQAKLGVFDTIKVVKELGFDVIEFAGFPQLPPGETPLSFARESGGVRCRWA